MDKKGFLLAEETLKMIIAVIGISFLVLFLVSLYFTNINQKKLEQANQELKNSEESIQKIIANIDSEEREKNLVSPAGWFLFSFTGEKKPDQCLKQNCICICGGVYDNFVSNAWEALEIRQAKECKESGSCLVVKNLKSFEKIEIKNPKEKLTKILIKKESGEITLKEKE